MNNFKKIGLTALAASLVSVSANAGELTASGSASITAEGWSGAIGNSGPTAWSMGNSVNFAGSGELDNGLTVSMAFELDQGSANNSSTVLTITQYRFHLIHWEQLSSLVTVDLQLQVLWQELLLVQCGITLMEKFLDF